MHSIRHTFCVNYFLPLPKDPTEGNRRKMIKENALQQLYILKSDIFELQQNFKVFSMWFGSSAIRFGSTDLKKIYSLLQMEPSILGNILQHIAVFTIVAFTRFSVVVGKAPRCNGNFPCEMGVPSIVQNLTRKDRHNHSLNAPTLRRTPSSQLQLHPFKKSQ